MNCKLCTFKDEALISKIKLNESKITSLQWPHQDIPRYQHRAEGAAVVSRAAAAAQIRGGSQELGPQRGEC